MPDVVAAFLESDAGAAAVFAFGLLGTVGFAGICSYCRRYSKSLRTLRNLAARKRVIRRTMSTQPMMANSASRSSSDDANLGGLQVDDNNAEPAARRFTPSQVDYDDVAPLPSSTTSTASSSCE